MAFGICCTGQIRYLKETLNEILRQCRFGVFLRAEVLEDVGELLPVVECFLQSPSVSMPFAFEISSRTSVGVPGIRRER